MMPDFIPVAVRRLMAHRWRDKPPGYTKEIASWVSWDGLERRRDPSYYLVGESVTDEYVNDFTAFSYREMLALHKQGALGEASKHLEPAGDKQGYVIANEFAAHSLQEFLNDVTRAWEAHRQRLSELTFPVPEDLGEGTETAGEASIPDNIRR